MSQETCNSNHAMFTLCPRLLRCDLRTRKNIFVKYAKYDFSEADCLIQLVGKIEPDLWLNGRGCNNNKYMSNVFHC